MSASNAHVKWAQRKETLLVTIEVVDATGVSVTCEDRAIRVTGHGVRKTGSPPEDFAVTLNLNGPLASAGHSFSVLGQGVQIQARKATPGHWDKICAEASKALRTWLSVDWGLWKDEDEENDNEKLNFAAGGYGDLGNMVNFSSTPRNTVADEDDTDERPPADLSDLGV